MSSKLRHITRRRKNALKALGNINYGQHSPAAVDRMNEEKQTLNHRINGGDHSSDWFKKQSRRKSLAQETEAA